MLKYAASPPDATSIESYDQKLIKRRFGIHFRTHLCSYSLHTYNSFHSISKRPDNHNIVSSISILDIYIESMKYPLLF